MSVRFSLVYPTRHRPAFIRQALRFLEKQQYQDFEVIVSDNYIDPTLSCENECESSSLANLKYVHPSQPVGMVENWNYALQFASGDYICYFTDKMFVLPHTLSAASNCIEKTQSEVVSWLDNSYSPKKFPDYFGEGEYFETPQSLPAGAEFALYDPHRELSNKGRALVARSEQDKVTYVRGKICFGAYSSELCNRIIERTGALFHNVAPDYSSMILGLSLTRSAAEIGWSGIVHVNTDLSNGRKVAVQDELALKFLTDLGNIEEILNDFLVPGLYCSAHNMVAHDYLTLKKKYSLDFQFDAVNWLVHITEDLDIPGRQWSTKEVEMQQRLTLKTFIDNLPKRDHKRYKKTCQIRCQKRKELLERAQKEQLKAYQRQVRANRRTRYAQNTKKIVRALLPEIAINTLRNWLPQPDPQLTEPAISPPQPNNYRSHIEDILE